MAATRGWSTLGAAIEAMPLPAQTSSCCSLRASSQGVIPLSWVYPNFPSVAHCCCDTRTKDPCLAVTTRGARSEAAPWLFSSTTLPPNGERAGEKTASPARGTWGHPQEQSTAQHSDGLCQPQHPVKKKLLLCPWTDPVRWSQHLQKQGVLSAPCSGHVLPLFCSCWEGAEGLGALEPSSAPHSAAHRKT